MLRPIGLETNKQTNTSVAKWCEEMAFQLRES